MPTGYTDAINKGATFNEFVMGCARAMGACIMMRDDPSGKEIPERFEPSDYNSKALTKAQNEHKRLMGMNLVDATKEALKEHAAKIESHNKWIADEFKQRTGYKAMLEKVRAWKSPSDDHNGLKDFMIEQITSSIKFDCHPPPKDVPMESSTGSEWKQRELEHVARDIEYHTKAHAEEVARTEGRNKWIKQLRDSLTG